jgi:hypothetical protein
MFTLLGTLVPLTQVPLGVLILKTKLALLFVIGMGNRETMVCVKAALCAK